MKFTLQDWNNPTKMLENEDLINAELLSSPGDPAIYALKAGLELHKENFNDAIALMKQAIGFEPKRADLYSQLAAIYGFMGDMDNAGKTLQHGYSISKTTPTLNWNFALWLLHNGKFELGWDLYRWRKVHMPGHRRFLQPEWEKNSPERNENKTLLVWSEQGLGDQLMMFRYMKYIKQNLGFKKVIFECNFELYTLFSSNIDGIDQIYVTPQDFSSPYPFDEHISIMDLPYYLSIPRWDGRKYLEINPIVGGCWKPIFEGVKLNETKKIGICWSGSSSHVNDKNRSAGLKEFEPLAKFGQLVSLQKETTEPALKGIDIVDISAGMVNAEYTASLLKELDCIVTVDTFIAHLAGALGIKCYLLLPYANEWRWQTGEGKSKLYSSIEMFKQPEVGDWKTPMDRICQILAGQQ